MTRVSLGVRLAALACTGLAFALGPPAAPAQELPPDIQVDLYLLRADRHIQNEAWNAALEALDVVLALQAANGLEVPAALWFRPARVALNAGHPQTAVTSVTRYLTEVGRRGEDYVSALALLDEAQMRGEAGAMPTPPPAADPPPVPPAVGPVPAPVAAPEADEAVGRLSVLFPLVGMNAATMSFASGGPLTLDASRRTGVAGGVAVAFPSPVGGDRFGIRIGAHYAQKGAGVALRADAAAGAAEVSFESVDFTALVRVSAPPTLNLPLYALVGPYASFEVDCRIVVEAGAGMGRFSASDDCANANLDTQSFDFGLSGGLGFEIGAGANRINVGLLYSHGLQDIDKYTGESAKHRVLSILAGVATTF